MADKLRVFLCHAVENKPVVNNLFEDLVASGFDPWLDTEALLPGMDWVLEIKKAMRVSDAVMVCMSTVSISKEGFVQKELKIAQDIQDEKPSGTIFLIPVKLDKCETPFELKGFQWGDYPAQEGFDKLIRSLNTRAKQLGKKEGSAKKKRP